MRQDWSEREDIIGIEKGREGERDVKSRAPARIAKGLPKAVQEPYDCEGNWGVVASLSSMNEKGHTGCHECHRDQRDAMTRMALIGQTSEKRDREQTDQRKGKTCCPGSVSEERERTRGNVLVQPRRPDPDSVRVGVAVVGQ